MFSAAVDRYWRTVFDGPYAGVPFRFVVSPGLDDGLRLVTLTSPDGSVAAATTPATAAEIGCPADAAALHVALAAAGLRLHGADHVFYLPEASHADRRPARPDVRRLGEGDVEAFHRFEARATAEDLDAALVDLDDDVAVGAFDGDRLVAVGSSYRFEDSALWDLGVLTLPEHRGRGYGLAVVDALSHAAFEAGGEPQYRCQTDNAASIALAARAGFVRFADWDLVQS
ncbi:GNAT family N-acetyltransferase [Tsukamurella sputi]|uniref:GNAT family N-acetyltransferase n=1 Tax=Tsukamurella sputi TaxID=2591848 RepID=A0A5C5RVH9_9ACTN|nr:GNAT family N-acetyltransferase [Tsukamurella sputi]TWS26523.1 GNAT family N-acetyltransferase [Tsukamurella sputi]